MFPCRDKQNICVLPLYPHIHIKPLLMFGTSERFKFINPVNFTVLEMPDESTFYKHQARA
jgi:hypothetical protein